MVTHALLLASRQGKIRLNKWFTAIYNEKQRRKATRDIIGEVIQRKSKMCNFIDYEEKKVVYKRYASLYFVAVIDEADNVLITIESIHRYVEILDQYFGSVCELDIIFNFEKAYFILDEYMLAGEMQESSRKAVLHAIAHADDLQEECDEQDSARNFLEDLGLA